MTKIFYYPDEHRMEIRGHSGAAPAGSDIVCAAVSSLTFALMNAATEVPEWMTNVFIDNTGAVIRVQCYPDEEQEPVCREMFRTILAGFDNLAETYPDHVKLIGGSNG